MICSRFACLAAAVGLGFFLSVSASAQTFNSAGGITIPAGPETHGPGDPYGSTISVAGVMGPVAKVTVTLSGLTHTHPDDLDFLLVGPTGVAVMLISDAGGSADVAGIDLTFDDFVLPLPPDEGALGSGTYRVSNYGAADDALPAPAVVPTGTTLSAFNSLDPNGEWKLYIFDDSSGDVGQLAGWSITFLCGIEVSNTNNAGAGSLRRALSLAELNPGLDVICFNIPGPGPHVIALDSQLPMIDDPVIIDGLTQPGASHDTWPPTLKIVLDGANVGLLGDGIELNAGASGSIIRGLVIQNFNRFGIAIDGASDCLVQCNYIGVGVDGKAGAGNGRDGVIIGNGAVNTVIGCDGDGANDANERNLISGNGGCGVRIVGEDTDNCRVAGNFIGTNAHGNMAIPNAGAGVWLEDSSGHVVGTNGDGIGDEHEGNLISGNGDTDVESDAGVLIDRSSDCVVAGNLIGVALDGVTPLGNVGDGVCISGVIELLAPENPASNNRIGTNADGVSDELERNVISGNGDDGVDIGTSVIAAARNNRVAGNYIGVGADGVTAVGNGEQGVDIQGADADDNFIGFDQPGADIPLKGNVIAFNSLEGVVVRGDNILNASRGNWIRGNSIHSNGGLGIDLGGDGVTPNDDTDLDNGANEFKNFPIITSIVGNSISGTYNSVADTVYDIDLYQDEDGDPSGHGEGKVYLGSTTVLTDNTGAGVWSLNVVFRSTVHVVSATATDRGPSRGTSEFGPSLGLGTGCERLACENIGVSNDSGQCFAIVEFGPLVDPACIEQGYVLTCTINDGMGGQIEITSPHQFPIGVTTVTCTLTAPIGLPVDDCTFDVTVTNISAPEIVCPDDIVTGTDPGVCGALIEFAPELVFPCDNTPRGGLVGIECRINGELVSSPYLFPTGITTVECCLVGTSGGRGEPIDCCSFTVEVTDYEPPMFVCRREAEVQAGACGTVVLTESDVVETFTDNCELDCDVAGVRFAPMVLECPPLNVPIEIVVTATDCHGNSSTCFATVIVRGDDCNGNGLSDACDICNGTSLDCNDNWVPDECECFWCNVSATVSAAEIQPDVNAQLSHVGGGTECGEKVADDFYLEPGCMHRITAVRGRMITTSHPQLLRARLEIYEDCNGFPVNEPFFVADYQQDDPIPSEVLWTEPAPDGESLVVQYRFDLCDACLWLEGGKTYWVSIIGLPDRIDMDDLSYWFAGNEHLPLIGNVPVKRSGVPGATWGTCNYDAWQRLDECCIGCVNMEFCVDGYSCPIIWDNGDVDLVNRGGSPSGAHQQYHDRTADSFVVKTCRDEEICLIEAWIWTNCDPVHGFVELYDDLPCGPPELEDAPFVTYSGEDVEATRFDETIVVNGRTHHLWRLRVKEPKLTLLNGRNYWVSAGAVSTGNFNTNSFFAWSTYGCNPCNGAESFRITPGQHRSLRPPATDWADANPRRDFAFLIAAKAIDAIPQDSDGGQGATPHCAADANGDGTVAVDDIFTFLSAWFSGCP